MGPWRHAIEMTPRARSAWRTPSSYQTFGLSTERSAITTSASSSSWNMSVRISPARCSSSARNTTRPSPSIAGRMSSAYTRLKSMPSLIPKGIATKTCSGISAFSFSVMPGRLKLKEILEVLSLDFRLRHRRADRHQIALVGDRVQFLHGFRRDLVQSQALQARVGQLRVVAHVSEKLALVRTGLA